MRVLIYRQDTFMTIKWIPSGTPKHYLFFAELVKLYQTLAQVFSAYTVFVFCSKNHDNRTLFYLISQ